MCILSYYSLCTFSFSDRILHKDALPPVRAYLNLSWPSALHVPQDIFHQMAHVRFRLYEQIIIVATGAE